jgi:hypothetical protein
MDSAICFDAPFRLDFLVSPRLAAKAAPAAICCFLDFAGIPLANRYSNWKRIYAIDAKNDTLLRRNTIDELRDNFFDGVI